MKSLHAEIIGKILLVEFILMPVGDYLFNLTPRAFFILSMYSFVMMLIVHISFFKEIEQPTEAQ